MDRETFRSAITAAAVNVVKAFSLRRGEGPVLKPMLPDLTDKSIHSKWNVRLGELFVNDFLRIGWADEGDASVVTELFFTHLVHLRRTYQAQLLVAENGGELTQTQRDNARAIARVNRRRYVCFLSLSLLTTTQLTINLNTSFAIVVQRPAVRIATSVTSPHCGTISPIQR